MESSLSKSYKKLKNFLKFTYSVQFSHSIMSNSLWPHEPQHARLPCPSPTPRVYPNSCPLSRWCHPTISSSVIPFSSCPQSFPASGCFEISQLFTWGGQSIGVSASASLLPKNTQDWSPLGWTGWISLQSKGLWDECSCTVVWAFLSLPFFGIGMKTDLFQSSGHCRVFKICWHIECSTLTASSFQDLK